MGWKVVFSTRSAEDLRRIVEFISRDDPIAAERFGLALIGQAELLAHAPFIGIPMPERANARLFPVGAFLIIYRPETKRETVRILRFWHGARGTRPLR
jgi:plasmid stabilization system protein ParE